MNIVRNSVIRNFNIFITLNLKAAVGSEFRIDRREMGEMQRNGNNIKYGMR